MLLPKIIYDAGAGAVTLNFTYPPVQKPGADKKHAERHDATSSGGLVQSVIERKETYRTLQMDFVPQSDLADWEAFFDYAVTGGSFDYYPDATSGTHDSWTLQDTDWDPARAFMGTAKFKFQMRRVITL